MRVNYYFAMKKQIGNLNSHAKKLNKKQEDLRKNSPIPEEGGEEEKTPNYNGGRGKSPISSSQTRSYGVGAG